MARVSIMIPTYNYGLFLGETIQSVLDQTYQDFEIIIVDDGSTDNTADVVNSFRNSRVRYIFQGHHGVATADNTAIRAASGEYITGIGADDLYLPQNLEIKVKLLDSRPNAGLVYSDAYLFDDASGQNLGRLWRSPKGPFPCVDPVKAAKQPLKTLLFHGCYILFQASLIRREVFDKVGYFDESLPTYEDWELFIRIIQHFSSELIDIPLIRLRQHSANLTGNQENMYKGAVASAKKVLNSGTLSKEEAKLLVKRLVPQHVTYARRALHNGKEKASRKALAAAIKFTPWNIKFYGNYLISFLGTKKINTLRSFRAKLTHHSKGS